MSISASIDSASYFMGFFRNRLRRYLDYRNAERPISNTSNSVERPELEEAMQKYQTVRDCMMGQDHIKSKGELYLPRPNTEISVKEDVRYVAYLQRAVFLNATGHTVRTIVGKLFSKAPTIELPVEMESMIQNVNGEGLAFDQLMEKCVSEVFSMGRCGIYADFPIVKAEAASLAETEMMSPSLVMVKAEDIINWEIDRYSQKLKLVVVREKYEEREGYAVKIKYQYREHRLEKGVYTVNVHRPADQVDRGFEEGLQQDYEIVETNTPMLPGGQPWDTIPFAIMGSVNNDWEIDDPPVYSIANYDLALYRNSADAEESAFLAGQPTLYVSGIDEQWAEDMGITNFKMGSGQVIPLPEKGSTVGLVQANPQTMTQSLMEDKYKVLRHLGAVFVEEKMDSEQTATGAIYQALQTHATLITTSRNVTDAIRKVTGFAAMFLGIDPESEDIKIKLNSEILDNPLGVTGLQTALQLWKDGGMSWDEFREQLRIQGLTLHTPEEALELIEQEGLGDISPDPGEEPDQQEQPFELTNEDPDANEEPTDSDQ